MKQTYTTVVFDLDGTLLNTLDDLADSTNVALALHCMPSRTLDEVRHFVGNGIRKLVERAVPENTPPDVLEAVLSDFERHYSGNMRNKTHPYEGVLALLDVLKASGISTAVVSNKFAAAVGPLLADYFGDRIAVGIGEGNGIPKKPAPQGVYKALSLLGADATKALFIGDSDIDIETGKNAGLFTVGCTWGFRDRLVLEQAGADAIIDEPLQLLVFLSLQ